MDIKQIKATNGTIYDIKDATARETLATKQPKLIAGSGIKIVGNVISLQEGGGSLDVEYDVTTKGSRLFECYTCEWDYQNHYLYRNISTDKWYGKDMYLEEVSDPSQLELEIEKTEQGYIEEGKIYKDSYGNYYYGNRTLSRNESKDLFSADVTEHKTDTIVEIIPTVEMSSDFYEAPQGKAVKTVKLPMPITQLPCSFNGEYLRDSNGNALNTSGKYYEAELSDGTWLFNDYWYHNNEMTWDYPTTIEVGSKFYMYVEINGTYYKTNIVYVVGENN